MEEKSNWRDMGPDSQENLLEEVRTALMDRLEEGIAKYHSDVLGFQGDPLTHIGEELFDAIVYFIVLRRQISYKVKELLGEGWEFTFMGKHYKVVAEEVQQEPAP